MDKASALGLLGLEGNPGEGEIHAALARKKEDLASKQASAPTESLKAKFASLLAKLDEAESVLLRQASGASNPAQAGSRSSPLSQTKLADLPQGQQSYTGFDSGENAARIHLQRGHKLANRYEIREQIGAGGMGAVYRAFDHTKQEDIALKVLLPALMQNERARQRFLDEARISARLSHPNIVNVHDVQQDGDFFFLTMELLHGQDLRQLMEARQLSRQPFDESEARTLASTLAGALAYAHQYTVHRDIKPENIWVTEEGDYKIMDFGIARVQSTSQRTQTGAAMGTAYYMAPEQLKGTSSIDGRADQYALGVLLYELLSGDVPAGRFKPLREIRKDISKGFAAAVEKSLETRAEDRFADMKAFADALQSKSGGGISLPELPWEKIGIAAAVLVAVLGLGVVVSSSGGLSSLIPMSAEEKAQREAQLARLQGEIKVLKQRLEASRRDLDSDIRDAERNKSSQLKALQEWQRLTETGIFASNRISEAEGTLSMAETLLRKEQYQPAEKAFADVRTEYQSLNDDFKSGERLGDVVREAEKHRSDWQRYEGTNAMAKFVPGGEKAATFYDQAKQSQSLGRLTTAIQDYRVAIEHWRAARQVAGSLGSAEQSARKARDDWQAYAQKYGFTGNSPSASQAKQGYEQSLNEVSKGRTKEADSGFIKAARLWQAARQDKEVVAKVQTVEAGWAAAAAKAESERRQALAAAEKERQRKAEEAAAKLIGKFVDIPAGTFLMGSDDYRPPVNRLALGFPGMGEVPAHAVTVKAFRMMEHEVTFGLWDACVAGGGCSRKPADLGWGRGNRPVIEVSWNDITQQFIPWLNRKTGLNYRLPSEAEWEYAARAGSATKYSWGDAISCAQARYGRDSAGECSNNRDGPVSVKSFAPNAFGLYDMYGNVMEFVQDCWNPNYQGAPMDGRAWVSGDCGLRVGRGGSWRSYGDELRSTWRGGLSRDLGFNEVGFRLVQDR